MTLRLTAIATLAALTHAHARYWLRPRQSDWLYYSDYRMDFAGDAEHTAPSPYWTASNDAYELKLALPDVEPATVSASLASGADKVEVVAERKIDGCSCRPSIIKEVALPYRPRAEDVELAMGNDGVLTIRLARHAKTDTPTPLTVHVQARDKEASETRPLRFVPHASAVEATAPSVEEQEKTLTEKFRGAALATVAATSSAKEAAAASAEGGNATPDAEPAAAASVAAADDTSIAASSGAEVATPKDAV